MDCAGCCNKLDPDYNDDYDGYKESCEAVALLVEYINGTNMIQCFPCMSPLNS
jgi:hypothetical protein